ncbi:hypothetical protein M427DRAFT_36609 [Gonapodya prolifera JEL478]|uniref:Uncharacterized protein n=1 Tax=Gonapodya prolifera (strain JEL478) TaxID=1344416 RepID=A0A139A2D0_GONPJ|nr:hypothetical protein M427DRAFT_36609 [Gonapodya prolifera JEL478]|eukprot:KXS10798.1 hypothetical protein M427DRAFT_36609 [Gonapodya prolifera JEL478]
MASTPGPMDPTALPAVRPVPSPDSHHNSAHAISTPRAILESLIADAVGLRGLSATSLTEDHFVEWNALRGAECPSRSEFEGKGPLERKYTRAASSRPRVRRRRRPRGDEAEYPRVIHTYVALDLAAALAWHSSRTSTNSGASTSCSPPHYRGESDGCPVEHLRELQVLLESAARHIAGLFPYLRRLCVHPVRVYLRMRSGSPAPAPAPAPLSNATDGLQHDEFAQCSHAFFRGLGPAGRDLALCGVRDEVRGDGSGSMVPGRAGAAGVLPVAVPSITLGALVNSQSIASATNQASTTIADLAVTLQIDSSAIIADRLTAYIEKAAAVLDSIAVQNDAGLKSPYQIDDVAIYMKDAIRKFGLKENIHVSVLTVYDPPTSFGIQPVIVNGVGVATTFNWIANGMTSNFTRGFRSLPTPPPAQATYWHFRTPHIGPVMPTGDSDQMMPFSLHDPRKPSESNEVAFVLQQFMLEDLSALLDSVKKQSGTKNSLYYLLTTAGQVIAMSGLGNVTEQHAALIARDAGGLRAKAIFEFPLSDYPVLNARSSALLKHANGNLDSNFSDAQWRENGYMFQVTSLTSILDSMKRAIKSDFSAVRNGDLSLRQSIVREVGATQTYFMSMLKAFAQSIKENKSLNNRRPRRQPEPNISRTSGAKRMSTASIE